MPSGFAVIAINALMMIHSVFLLAFCLSGNETMSGK